MEDYPTANFIEVGGKVSYSSEVGEFELGEEISKLLGQEIETDNFPSLPKNFFLFEDTDINFDEKADIAITVLNLCVENDKDTEHIQTLRSLPNKDSEENLFTVAMLEERIGDNIGYIQELIKKYKEI